MGERDYFLVLFLMFVNLLLANFFAFSSSLFAFEIIILGILIILTILFIFASDNMRYAYLFFALSILGNLYLFFTQLSFLPMLLVIINAVILFYVYSSQSYRQLLESQPNYESEGSSGQPGWKRVDEIVEPGNVFSSIGSQELEDISSLKSSSVVYDKGQGRAEFLKDLPQHDLFVERKTGKEEPRIMTDAEYQKQEERKRLWEGYKHIDELNLPELEEKPVYPGRRYSYQLYYEKPRETLEFKPIEHVEQKIERRHAAQRLRKQRVRELEFQQVPAKKPARRKAAKR